MYTLIELRGGNFGVDVFFIKNMLPPKLSLKTKEDIMKKGIWIQLQHTLSTVTMMICTDFHSLLSMVSLSLLSSKEHRFFPTTVFGMLP